MSASNQNDEEISSNPLYDLLSLHLIKQPYWEKPYWETNKKLFLKDLVIKLIETKQVTRAEVIEGYSRLFQEAVDLGVKIQLIVDLLFITNLKDNPINLSEIFWPIIKSNILFELDNYLYVEMVSGILYRLAGSEIVRSYLVQTLLTENKLKWENALIAFEVVGHTIDSLKAVEHILPRLSEDDHELYISIFYSAAEYSFDENRVLELAEEELEFLKSFCKKGLSAPSKDAVGYAQALLKRLEEVSTN